MTKPRKHIVYLAVPYSHPNPKWRELRVLAADLAAAALMQAGFVVFSPISHSHPISLCLPVEVNNLEFWQEQDFPLLGQADIMVTLALPGMLESNGVRAEELWCLKHNIPYVYITLEEVYYEEFDHIQEAIEDWPKA